ncbi:unnamed protein product [Cuscuta europaea]|uniref:Transmembrane protein n=1 Tax=Cuscuta europaea TaxID=41803 RepID=A0A9P1DXB4_CUSEU|nr:unnamed protein product [Cuscuta europaea]
MHNEDPSQSMEADLSNDEFDTPSRNIPSGQELLDHLVEIKIASIPKRRSTRRRSKAAYVPHYLLGSLAYYIFISAPFLFLFCSFSFSFSVLFSSFPCIVLFSIINKITSFRKKLITTMEYGRKINIYWSTNLCSYFGLCAYCCNSY